MSDAVTAKLLELAKRASGSVQVGFIDNDQAPIAFWNEFGHKGPFPAPPRPFFRTMVANNSPQWPAMMARALKTNKIDGAKTLAYMGEEIDGALKESITEGHYLALSPVTLMLRSKFGNHPENIRARDVIQAQRDVAAGKTAKVTETQEKPLIWTGDMLNSTGYRVNQGDVMVLNTTSEEYEARK
jgi:hypothetical protein